MLQLLRFLIFGKQCPHQWKLESTIEHYSNDKKYLYSCQKCGKMKKVRMRTVYFEGL